MRTSRVITVLGTALASGTFAYAAPVLSLVKSETANVVTDSIQEGTSLYQLDLKLDTDDLAISGLSLYLATTPADSITYGSTPVTALSSPFTESDLAASPAAGAIVQPSGMAIALFKASGADYLAVDGASILRVELDTASLAPGQYIITPVPFELSNADVALEGDDFGTSGSFQLTVTSIPEPTQLALLCVSGAMLIARRRNRE